MFKSHKYAWVCDMRLLEFWEYILRAYLCSCRVSVLISLGINSIMSSWDRLTGCGPRSPKQGKYPRPFILQHPSQKFWRYFGYWFCFVFAGKQDLDGIRCELFEYLTALLYTDAEHTFDRIVLPNMVKHWSSITGMCGTHGFGWLAIIGPKNNAKMASPIS